MDLNTFSAPEGKFVVGQDPTCPAKVQVFAASHDDDRGFFLCVPSFADPAKDGCRNLFSQVVTLFVAYSGLTTCAYCKKQMLNSKEKLGIPRQIVNIHPTKKDVKSIIVLSCGSDMCNKFAWMARLHLSTEVYETLRIMCYGCNKDFAKIACDHCRSKMFCSEECKKNDFLHSPFCEKNSSQDLFYALVNRFHIPLALWQQCELDVGVFEKETE